MTPLLTDFPIMGQKVPWFLPQKQLQTLKETPLPIHFGAMQTGNHSSGSCRNTHICCPKSLFTTKYSLLQGHPSHFVGVESWCSSANCSFGHMCLFSSCGPFFLTSAK